jgi:hypothetical protein
MQRSKKSFSGYIINVWCALPPHRAVKPMLFEETVDGTILVYRDIIITRVNVTTSGWTRFLASWRLCHVSYVSWDNDILAGFLRRSSDLQRLVAPRSPHLCPDFFLRGYLKGMVYRVNAHTLEELKTHIEAAIANVMTAWTLRKVSANMVKRVRACIHIKSTLVNICFKHEVLLLLLNKFK